MGNIPKRRKDFGQSLRYEENNLPLTLITNPFKTRISRSQKKSATRR